MIDALGAVDRIVAVSGLDYVSNPHVNARRGEIKDIGAEPDPEAITALHPDLVLLVPRGKCPFLAIELKYGRNGQSERQKAYQRALEAIGARYVVVRSVEEFKKVVEEYLQ